MRVLALAICGYVAALQPARNAPRQSLAVRQAPRSVHQRVQEPTPSSRKTRHTTQGGDAYGASGTSFYTTTEKQDSYDSLDTVLDAKCKDAGVRKVIVEMLDACGEITEALRSALVTVEGSANTFGDAQLSVDVIADEIMWEVAKGSEVVAYGASEEEPEIVKCNPKGEYTICWDPLDGSSIVDNNWAVGTILGIWGSETGILGAPGRAGAALPRLPGRSRRRARAAAAAPGAVPEHGYGASFTLRVRAGA